MRRFLILLLLLTIPLVCRGDGWFYGGVAASGGSCASCTTSNDSIRYESGVSQTADGVGVTTAWQFTVSSTVCVTGIYVNCSNPGSQAMPAYIYTDSAGSPGTAVTGCSCTIQTGTSKADVFGAFAATQTLSVGTYWVVFEGGVNTATGSNNSGTGAYMYYAGGWQDADAAGYYWRMGVYGCAP